MTDVPFDGVAPPKGRTFADVLTRMRKLQPGIITNGHLGGNIYGGDYDTPQGARRFIEALVQGVSATDPLSLGLAGLLVLGLTPVAAWVPAQRAARVDPMRALRTE